MLVRDRVGKNRGPKRGRARLPWRRRIREANRNYLLRLALRCRGDWTPIALILQGATAIESYTRRLIFVQRIPPPH